MGALRDHYQNHIGGLLLCIGTLLLSIGGNVLYRVIYEKKGTSTVFVELEDTSESMFTYYY
jgi:hypothetical protein